MPRNLLSFLSFSLRSLFRCVSIKERIRNPARRFSVAVNEKGTTPSKYPPQSPPPNRSLVHPLDQHKLLYILRYDYQLILYAFSTLQIILSRAPHQFVCASSSTSIGSSKTPHQDKIKELLVRHRRSLLGKGFYGALYESPVSPSGKYSANGCFGIDSVVGEFLFSTETGKASNGHTKHFRCTTPPPPLITMSYA